MFCFDSAEVGVVTFDEYGNRFALCPMSVGSVGSVKLLYYAY